MKKIFILVSAMLASVMLASCSKDINEGPNNNPNDGPSGQNQSLIFTKAEGAYYGEIKGEGVGFYSITFYNDNGDQLRLDCYGSVSNNARNARLTSGDYKPGDVSTMSPRTFFTASSASDEEGTIYWKNDKAYPIDGGSITVQLSGGTYAIRFDLTSGSETVKASFNGEFTLANKVTVSPRPSDPNPRRVSEIVMEYSGRSIYSPDNALFGIKMYYKGSSSDAANAEALTITGYMPVQENNNQAYLSEGVYTISANKDDMSEFKLDAGSVVSGQYIGTFETFATSSGAISKCYLITDGTLTVEKDDNGRYTVTADMTGYRADNTGIISDKAENIVYQYVGNLSPMTNYADPISALTESVDLGTFSNQALCQVVHNYYDSSYTAYFYYLWGPGIDVIFDAETNTIDMQGSGPMIMIFIFGAPQYGTPPTGSYPMGELYGFIHTQGEEYKDGTAQPGSTFIDNSIDPTLGCWYCIATRSDSGLGLSSYAGAIGGLNNGHVITSNDGDTHNVEFFFTDRNGHTIKGTYSGPMEYADASRAASSGYSKFYVPSCTMYGVNAPVSMFSLK